LLVTEFQIGVKLPYDLCLLLDGNVCLNVYKILGEAVGHSECLEIYNSDLPTSADGTLEWVSTNKILNKNIIPTTLAMLKQWQSQNFSPTPFELHVKTISEENGIKQVTVTNI
jgi:hypothetical protein